MWGIVFIDIACNSSGKGTTGFFWGETDRVVKKEIGLIREKGGLRTVNANLAASWRKGFPHSKSLTLLLIAGNIPIPLKQKKTAPFRGAVFYSLRLIFFLLHPVKQPHPSFPWLLTTIIILIDESRAVIFVMQSILDRP